jgi:hypothetical protein
VTRAYVEYVVVSEQTGEEEYRSAAVEVVSFTGPECGTWWSPGDGGEIDLGPIVEIHGLHRDGSTEAGLLNTIVMDIAAHRGIPYADAGAWVEDQALQQVLQDLADDFDDRG